MKIGIVGVSSITMDFANRAAQSGHDVLINHNRDNNIIRECVQKMGSKVKLVNKEQAVKAGIIILFVPREDLKSFLCDLPDMSEKIIIHTNNPIFSTECFSSTVKTSSEIIASLLPAAHVVKILNIVEPNILLHKNQNHTGNEIFYTGTDTQAKRKVKSFFKTLDLAGIDFDDQLDKMN
jgi:predicted dinucleotide-binding enzyme